MFAALAVAVLVGCGMSADSRDPDEPPDREAALLLAGQLDDPSQPGVGLRQYLPLFAVGESSHGSRGNAGLFWVSVAPGQLNVWQYVFRYGSDDQAKTRYREHPPEVVHADDGAFKWSVSPGVPGISADEQKLVTPDASPPQESADWYFWARYGRYVVEVRVIRGGSGPVQRADVERLVAQVDQAVRAAVNAEGGS